MVRGRLLIMLPLIVSIPAVALAVGAVALYLANQNLQNTTSLSDNEFSPNTPPIPVFDRF